MKKIVISIFLIIATMSTMLFAGCGGSKSEKKPEALAGNHDETADLSALEIKETGEFYGTYLYRNNKKYQMGVGQSNISISSMLYAITLNTADLSKTRVISMKNIPVPIIQENDRFYSTEKDIKIKSVNFVGYGPLVTVLDGNIHVEKNGQKLNQGMKYTEVLIHACDEKGNAISKENIAPKGIVTNLKYNQNVDISYKDTNDKWHVYITSADCSYYDLSEGWVNESIKVPTSTEGDYTVYDPTKLKKGYYAIFTGTQVHSIFYVSE